jgi:multicomponent Na+:H+ antiporter subunit E
MIGHLILRLTLWFLLTANFSPANIAIGLAVALLLPRPDRATESLKDWLQMLGKILWAIPQAYVEAFEMIFRPHPREDVVLERVEARRSSRLVFLDIFLITFTPKTIVLDHHPEGWYEVHRVRPRTGQRALSADTRRQQP